MTDTQNPNPQVGGMPSTGASDAPVSVPPVGAPATTPDPLATPVMTPDSAPVAEVPGGPTAPVDAPTEGDTGMPGGTPPTPAV